MCTVSWLHDPVSYMMLCNRDEKNTRKTAFPPRVLETNGVRYLAPLDGEHGGTWIAVNQYGLTLSLLNGRGSGTRSRGLLVRSWISMPTAERVTEAFQEAELESFAGFTLVALEPACGALVMRWDGKKKSMVRNGEACMPLTSSSYDAPGAQVHRRMELRRLLAQTGRLDPHLLHLFHSSHGGGAGPLTTCMHRNDAGTVSFSRVEVNASHVRLHYTPGAPCRNLPGVTVELERR